MRERPLRRRALVEHVELTAELHVVAHDEVDEAVGLAGRAGAARRAIFGSGGRPPAEPLTSTVPRTLSSGWRSSSWERRRRPRSGRAEPEAAMSRDEAARASAGGERAKARHSQNFCTVHWNPTGSDCPSMSGYIGRRRGQLGAARLDARERGCTSASNVESPLGFTMEKLPTLRSPVTVTTAAACSVFSLSNGTFPRIWKWPRTRRRAGRGTCRRRAP